MVLGLVMGQNALDEQQKRLKKRSLKCNNSRQKHSQMERVQLTKAQMEMMGRYIELTNNAI